MYVTLTYIFQYQSHRIDTDNIIQWDQRTYKMNCELMLTYDTPAYMFNVHKNQLSRQTGSRNLTGPKTLPTIWHTYIKLVTKYQISAINSCWEKCDEKYLGTDGRTDRGKTIYPPTPLRWSGGINIQFTDNYRIMEVMKAETVLSLASQWL
jgi:hypothetical protein